ncbi:eukaryotic translation initiation factor 5B [Coccinella septempunctata]|uniref:eukaryotic translation initiation factor 5B n=1 Tax=Coccinella septempunctata TaxID=41139 RepID=UPI001D08B693|nr:eukaryotic translation initiation factor 5B [Coccinella septempunctata]
MGKAKKGRKAGKGDVSESEEETLTTTVESTENNAFNKKTDNVSKEQSEKVNGDSKKEKKAKLKKSKNEESDSEDDKPVVSKIQKSFALLSVEDDVSDENINGDDTEKEVKSKAKSTRNNEKSKEQLIRKGKKARRKKEDSDEEIERALAEIALEHSGINEEKNNSDPQVKEKNENVEISDDKKSKKKKKDRQTEEPSVENTVSDKKEDGAKEDNESGIKTAAQKKKEKREKQKKKASCNNAEGAAEEVEKETKEADIEAEQDNEKDSKKKKKKTAKDEKEAKESKKGPGKKALAAMQEALQKIKEEEERLKREEEERIRREEEAEKARLEALRLEQERKERKKQKEKERKERLKAEGKLLTAKQKADRARAQALIDSLKAQGVELPDVGTKKPRPGTRVKPSKPKPQPKEEKSQEEPEKQEVPVEVEIVETTPEVTTQVEPEDDVKDAWDASSDEDDNSEETPTTETKKASSKSSEEKSKEDLEEESSSEESESEDSESDDHDNDEDDRTPAQKARDKALERIRLRKEEAEKNRTVDNLRAAIVCVLGHVDTGKTKILDKLRRTNVQDGEAGGITQQIGATNVPIEAIKENIRMVKGASEMPLRIPGLLIIDTPGHESFSNLRNRGSSLCDIAILVVDIMHGLEPQTIESINILKKRKTPFIVALNKIDRLYDWNTMNRKDIRDILKAQAQNTQNEFETRTKDVIVQFAQQGLNAALFFENPDIRSYVSLVPTSAITGEGMGNLLALIVEFCQNRLPQRLMYSDELQATVLEVKAISGLGTTIDVILVNGTLREGDTMLCAGTDGPIVTQIRSLLMPQPMKELRVKNAYIEYREIKAAQGVKIAAKELEKAIAGLNLYVANKPDEVEILKEEVAKELKSALSNIKLQERGVYVQASTLGSLEALLDFLRTSKIPYSGIRIGPVVKKDVMKASIMLEHDSQYATILAFDVKVEKDAQELADSLGVKIFQADIIYHLFDKFTAYREELKARKREEFKHIAVFPCKLRILPNCIFNSRDPIVCGVMVEAGVVREGTPICVPSKEFLDVGIVTSVESNHKPVENARKGMEVCVKIEPIPGESPKMFGRHFDEKDMLVSKISRQSIDACKDYFRDDLLKSDWQLMVELKKVFQIL